jgi:hypothetical protein
MKRIETLIVGILACAIWDAFAQNVASKEPLLLSFATSLIAGLLVDIAVGEYVKKAYFSCRSLASQPSSVVGEYIKKIYFPGTGAVPR